MSNDNSPRTLDSLALAHFVTGDYDNAISLQQRAVNAVSENDTALKEQLQAKLDKYQKAAKAKS